MNTIEIIASGICTGVVLACLVALTEYLSTIRIELKNLNHYKQKEVEIMQERWSHDKRANLEQAVLKSQIMEVLDKANDNLNDLRNLNNEDDED